jgi:hypothetical protein
MLYGPSLNIILCPNVPGNPDGSRLACPWGRWVPWVLSTTQKLLREQGSHEQALSGHHCPLNALQSVKWTVVSWKWTERWPPALTSPEQCLEFVQGTVVTCASSSTNNVGCRTLAVSCANVSGYNSCAWTSSVFKSCWLERSRKTQDRKKFKKNINKNNLYK